MTDWDAELAWLEGDEAAVDEAPVEPTDSDPEAAHFRALHAKLHEAAGGRHRGERRRDPHPRVRKYIASDLGGAQRCDARGLTQPRRPSYLAPMARSLVIVESPAKAKTISRFLGDGYDVKASVGHVADLPSKGLAVDVNNGFKPTYELTTRGKEVVKELRAALKDADELYLATDEDREGEAISWHLLEALKPTRPRQADGVPRDHSLRDRRSGAQPSWHRLRPGRCGRDPSDPRPPLRLRGLAGPVEEGQRGLSAGRVQSPATRLVVEREGSGSTSSPPGYWDIEATFATDPGVRGHARRRTKVRRVATGT